MKNIKKYILNLEKKDSKPYMQDFKDCISKYIQSGGCICVFFMMLQDLIFVIIYG